MNRRELLKAVSGVAAIPLKILNDDGRVGGDANAHLLEPGPFYLFVLNPKSADVEHFIDAFHGSGIKGAVVCAHDENIDDFCRIYKLEE